MIILEEFLTKYFETKEHLYYEWMYNYYFLFTSKSRCRIINSLNFDNYILLLSYLQNRLKRT